MTSELPAKMYIAEQRGHFENDHLRVYATFNFGNYFNEHKTAFGPLHLLNDNTLAGNHVSLTKFEEDMYTILLPIVGTIEYADNEGTHAVIHSGEMQCGFYKGNSGFVVKNPYDSALVNYLQIGIIGSFAKKFEKPQLFQFDIEGYKNVLVDIGLKEVNPALPFNMTICKLSSKKELTYFMDDPANSLYAFAIEGESEVDQRLLHARDGLGLRDIEKVEIEGLTNNAILLLIEMTQKR
jgi:redox-sensitive bicupin YhaK (pirin superfamily)